MYIYEVPLWPRFFWDEEEIASLLTQLRFQQGRFIGGMESIGFQIREACELESITDEIVKSSEIEGELLDHSLVRSSVARHLGVENAGLDIVDIQIEGIVDMMMDATQQCTLPLTKERLFQWHNSLFPKGLSGIKPIRVGGWRTTPVQVISGPMGKEKVHFEGPAALRVDQEMKLLLDWLQEEKKIDLVLQAAIAHLWFVTIHPFEDGNGRIGRAIADLLLARSEKSSSRFYSLSKQIQKERKDYYSILERTTKGTLDITPWLEWFLGCLNRAIEEAGVTLDHTLYKARVWESLADIPLNERQKKVIALLIDGFKGHLTSSKWAKISKCSQDTAHRDILDLINKGVMRKNAEGGRSASYSLIIFDR